MLGLILWSSYTESISHLITLLKLSSNESTQNLDGWPLGNNRYLKQSEAYVPN